MVERAAEVSPIWQLAELALVFGVLPVAVAVLPAQPLPPLLVLVVVAGIAAAVLGRGRRFDVGRLWRLAPGDAGRLGRMLSFWIASAALLAAAVAFWRPEMLFQLPRQHALQWLGLLVAYPLVSVLPQEVLYRAFFFHRYRRLLGDGPLLLVANAVAFSLLHLVFHNFLALALTFLGGLLFGITYRKSGHLPLVFCEHVLYGWAVFSVGLHPFFLGAALTR